MAVLETVLVRAFGASYNVALQGLRIWGLFTRTTSESTALSRELDDLTDQVASLKTEVAHARAYYLANETREEFISNDQLAAGQRATNAACAAEASYARLQELAAQVTNDVDQLSAGFEDFLVDARELPEEIRRHLPGIEIANSVDGIRQIIRDAQGKADNQIAREAIEA